MNNFSVPGTVVGTDHKITNKTDHATAFMDLHFTTQRHMGNKSSKQKDNF